LVLEVTTNLAPPVTWAIVTNTPQTAGSLCSVQIDGSQPCQFFRLIQNTATADGMALIPAGEFTIGDTLGEETDVIPTNVTVSAFYMDVNLVTYSLWTNVYQWATNHGYGFVNAGSGKAANHPAQTVDWYDCVKWCNARAQHAGLTQVYTNGGTDAVYVNWATNGYRLPTEAEWEKAARGGLSGQRFPWGDTISESQANYWSQWSGGVPYFSFDVNTYSGYNTNYNTGGSPYTSPVGSFAPNGYGLYDMAGNVNEWCWDWYTSPPYPTGSPYLGGIDPRGPATGSYRVLRGGYWNDWAYDARVADQSDPDFPFTADDYYGFRCVRGQ
jgi:formylglycine-generating enzyme required for sulfatase activity